MCSTQHLLVIHIFKKQNMEEEFFEVPDEEKLAIATHFLLSAPIGEFDEILVDVRKML